MISTIQVSDILGEFALTSCQGERLYDIIFQELKQQNVVELDFANVRVFGCTFFEFAVGQLLNHFDSERLKTSVRVVRLTPGGCSVLNRVILDGKINRFNGEKVWKVDGGESCA